MNFSIHRAKRCPRVVAGLAALAATGLGLVSAVGAHADDTGSGPLTIPLSSALLGSGSAIFPEYDISNWQRFELTVPAGTHYADSGDLVASMDAWVTDPASLGFPLPPKSSTQVIYVLDALSNALDDVVEITFPNPDGLTAGNVHLVYAYDETNGVWAVVSTATVSADETVLTSSLSSSDNLLRYHFVDVKALYNHGGGHH